MPRDLTVRTELVVSADLFETDLAKYDDIVRTFNFL